ncbi:MAG: XisI protein [Okeania sp. SIO3C4]|nr:XisI protein [Okeania sp. SIO3C4]
MDKLIHYQNIIKQILTNYQRISAQVPDPDIDEVLMFDDQRSQYLWFNIGWKNDRRIQAISVYIRIKNEKIYIEEDWTEEGIANELLRENVPKEDIVLAFHHPENLQEFRMREFRITSPLKRIGLTNYENFSFYPLKI